MGDHTGSGFIRKPFNDLLGPVNISFRFDSARSFAPSWQNCMEIRAHPVTERISAENDIQICTGASLAVKYPAAPILIGKRAFSDAGNKANSQNGFLGDLCYQQSEQMGDIVLAAEGKLGLGKVLVFGDTSSVQNGALPFSSQFIQNIFHWLTQGGTPCLKKQYKYLPFFLWFLFLLSLIPVWFNSYFFAVLWLILSLCLVQLPGRLLLPLEHPPCYEGRQSAAYIDNSHGQFFNMPGWRKNSIDGLLHNLMRNNYAPFIAKRMDTALLDRSKMWVFINPTKTFSPEEKNNLHCFMQNGGLILWAAGRSIREASLSFLTDFGLTFANLPLGPVKGKFKDYELQFKDAWPINIAGRVKKKTTVLFQKGEYPLVVFQRCAKGGIILISDARFLLNENIEHIDFFHEGNILFFRDLIETARGK